MTRFTLFVVSLIATILSSVQAACGAEAIALSFALPQEPVPATPAPVVSLEPPKSTAIAVEPSVAAPSTATEATPTPEPPVAPVQLVSFTVPDSHSIAASPTSPPPPAAPASPLPPPSPAAPSDLFTGGSESLVARTVGHAEGTRGADGSKNPAYHGHVDPGNGVWNRGTFSYQFGNAANLSPEAADQQQLARLQASYDRAVVPKAQQLGVELSLEEQLNAIDLINQAPLTVMEAGGFVERLAEAKRQKGLQAEQAILEGRVWAFWHPQQQRWDAPGLRSYDHVSKQESIRRDQERRMVAIRAALMRYRQEREVPVAKPRSTHEVANLIIGQNVPQS